MSWLESAQTQELPLGRGTRPSGGPVIVGVRAALLFRYLGFGSLFVASLMFYVWSRIDVQDTNVELENSLAWLEQLEQEQERLELELATRRDVSRLEASSAELRLTRDVQVVELEVP